MGPAVKGKLKTGTKMRLHFFEPMTLAILPIDLEVVREETIEINGKKVGATVVKTDAVTAATVNFDAIRASATLPLEQYPADEQAANP